MKIGEKRRMKVVDGRRDADREMVDWRRRGMKWEKAIVLQSHQE